MEQPLLPYENCCLGSINLSNMVIGGLIDYEKLKQVTRSAVLFLNRVLDRSKLPIPECQAAMEMTRKIGIGIMGLADMLIQLKIPYDSVEGREVTASVMEFVYTQADIASVELGEKEGTYLASDYQTAPVRRNACLVTIAPTGTLSTIANCSGGCEPYYAAKYTRDNIGKKFTMYNKWVTFFAEQEGCSEDDILEQYPELFKGAEDIHWKDHVKMQAALQPWVDSSISKTINMPNDATVADVQEAYELAWRLGCKGITIYRDGSRDAQVLSTDTTKPEEKSKDTVNTSGCCKAALPDILGATRYRVTVKGEKVYIIIAEKDGEPLEIFCKHPYGRDSNWDALCRSLSLSLRYGIPLTEVIKQLERSIKVINDTPSQLARILKTYLADKGKVVNACPECGAPIRFTEGCESCPDCSWSKCS